MSAFLNVLKWVAIPIVTTLIAWGVALMITTKDAPVDALMWAIAGLIIGLVIVLIVFLVLFFLNRAKANKLESGLGSSGGMDQRGEVEALRKAWKESLATLKASGVGGGGKRALQALPWFVIIGAPASGKSTLLRQSGIDFPVGDAALSGLQGTRNCDWWFSNVGVFLDTAGRYISDKSAQEWARFLELVRKQRSGAPINGCIIAIPAGDLLERTPEQVDLDARRIRARLDELIDHLGISFPVWVVVTKVDLIGGFAEFFSGLDATGRAQMMGWTADLAEGGSFDRVKFQARYAAVVHRMRELRPQMVDCSKLLERPMAYAFPDQMATMGEALSRMMHRIFEPNVYQETPFFRGLYITSATQEGTPLQKAAARIRQMLGAAPAAPDASQGLIKHCYFVKDLMHERIVQDRQMTWTTSREVERGKLKRLGINLTGASFGVLLTLIVLGSGMAAVKSLGGLEQHMDDAAKSRSAAEKCALLDVAAKKADKGNRQHLGMSHQGTLRDELKTLQDTTFRDGVVLAMIRGYTTDLSDATSSLETHVATFQSYRQTRELLERTAQYADAEAAGELPAKNEDKESEEDDAKEGEEEAAPEPEGAQWPAKFYDVAARENLVARDAAFSRDRVLGPEPDEAAHTQLLNVVWHNRALIGPTEELEAAYADVEAAFRSRAADYVSSAHQVYSASEKGTNAFNAFVDRWKTSFRRVCDMWNPVLLSPAIEDNSKLAALDALINAETQQENDATASTDGAAASLESIPKKLDLLRSSGAMTEEELATLPGYDSIKSFKMSDFKNADVQVATGNAHDALTRLTANLKALRDDVEGLLDGRWKVKADKIGAALEGIEQEGEAFAQKYESLLAPDLRRLEGIEEASALPEWTDCVVKLPRAVHRDTFLRAFVKGRDDAHFNSLATSVERVRDPADPYTAKALRDDLDELLQLVLATEQRHEFLVAPTIRTDARIAVTESFGRICKSAETHWDETLDSLPMYRRSHWKFLEYWHGEGKTAKVLDRLAEEFEPKWAKKPTWGTLKPQPVSDFAVTTWKLAEGVRERYATFAEAYRDVISPSVKTILGFQGIRSVDDTNVVELADAMSADGGGPRWRLPDGLKDDAGDVTHLAEQVDDLKRAFEGAENDLLAKIRDFFQPQWATVREALRSTSDTVEANKKLVKFDQLLRQVFKGGRSLLGKLTVHRDYAALRTQRTNAADIQARLSGEMAFRLSCWHIPKGFAALRVIYEEDGNTISHEWDPTQTGHGKNWQSFTFTPGKGDSFKILLFKNPGDPESDPGKKEVTSKRGGNCVTNILKQGFGDSDDATLTFGGSAQQPTVKFSFESADRDLIQTLVSGNSSRAAVEVPQDCVILK